MGQPEPNDQRQPRPGLELDLNAAFERSRQRIPRVTGESPGLFKERLLRHLWAHRGPRDFLTFDPGDVPGYGWHLRPLPTMILLLATSYVMFHLLYSAHGWMPDLGISNVKLIAVSQALMFAVAMLFGLLALPVYLPASGPPPPAAHGHDPQRFQRRIHQRMEQDASESACEQ